jgi:hypothetical protein
VNRYPRGCRSRTLAGDPRAIVSDVSIRLWLSDVMSRWLALAVLGAAVTAGCTGSSTHAGGAGRTPQSLPSEGELVQATTVGAHGELCLGYKGKQVCGPIVTPQGQSAFVFTIGARYLVTARVHRSETGSVEWTDLRVRPQPLASPTG